MGDTISIVALETSGRMIQTSGTEQNDRCVVRDRRKTWIRCPLKIQGELSHQLVRHTEHWYTLDVRNFLHSN